MVVKAKVVGEDATLKVGAQWVALEHDALGLSASGGPRRRDHRQIEKMKGKEDTLRSGDEE